MNTEVSVDEQHFDISIKYSTLVGANSFAHNLLFMRINSHLHTHQPGFPG